MFGVLCGILTSWGSENGYYHTVMLPLIALEMGFGELSFFGAFDLVCLCMPCAGVCSAVYLKSLYLPKDKKHRQLGWKGLSSNLLFGDFVEACYPYTLSNPPLLSCIRFACALAGAILTCDGYVLATAYLPLPVSLMLSNGLLWRGSTVSSIGGTVTTTPTGILGSACLVAFSISFFATLGLLRFEQL